MTALSCACHVPYECVIDGGEVAPVSATVEEGGSGANLESLSVASLGLERPAITVYDPDVLEVATGNE